MLGIQGNIIHGLERSRIPSAEPIRIPYPSVSHSRSRLVSVNACTCARTAWAGGPTDTRPWTMSGIVGTYPWRRVVRTDILDSRPGFWGCSRHPPGTPRSVVSRPAPTAEPTEIAAFGGSLPGPMPIVDATSTKQTRQPSQPECQQPSDQECQEPSQPSRRGPAETPPPLGPQRFSLYCPSTGSARSAVRLALLHDLRSRPRVRQLCAKGGQPLHRRGLERRRGETGVAVGSGGCPLLWVDAVHQEVTQRTLSAECQEPFQQSVRNPFRTGVTYPSPADP